jgi:hypothetical protein
MSVAAAKFGFDILMGLGAREMDKARVNAENTINEANTYAANLMRGANNELASKRGSLARWTQSVNNQRVAKNTGSAMEASAVNYRRQSDERGRASFEQQIAFDEQAGAQAAAGAFSGLTGGVIDAVAGTVALRRSRILEADKARTKAVAFDQGREQAAILREGLSAMDMNTIVDDIDYSTNVFTAQAKPGVGGILLNAAAGYVKNRDGKELFSFKG